MAEYEQLSFFVQSPHRLLCKRHSPTGDKVRETFSLNSNRDGLIKIGEVDIQQSIDSYEEDTDIHTAIRRLIGDPSLVKDIVGSDVHDIPDSLIDCLESIDRGQRAYTDLMKSGDFEQVSFSDLVRDPSKLKRKEKKSSESSPASDGNKPQ